ncbi:MAG: PHP domain-containing protein [Dehalococcoidia bacterium]|nr:PHP domain-containing protein [Dehalococcoidia bacterium]
MTSEPSLIRADLHNHTHFSPDSILSPARFVAQAVRRGLDCIAVTDHNTLGGAEAVREAAAATGLRVIAGEEVRTDDGEVLGLFLTQDIPRGLSAEETIGRIKAQGGLAGVPHPYDTLRSGLDPAVMLRLVDRLDFVEGLNARMVFSAHNDKAVQFASAHGLPLSAASDAHSRWEVGRAYVEMPGFTGPGDFLDSLRAGRLEGRLSTPLVHLISRYAMLRRKLGWRPR